MYDIAFGYLGVALGAGMVLIAAGFGIAKLASAALEGAARQPEAAGSLQTMMIIPAAMIEGAALFALVIFFLAGGALNTSVTSQGGAQAESHASASH
ncbi:MAG: ATP synthase F0 subunit C [Elusimicrobia bacterium CG1_02_63_36]|nr:MAG: ATP synthase F0 subunit C [Elusimicrobia bacterium CG1_02_63_36]PIP81452.1 MAG: ATP synthase F0 subunit C [Elusimicrobia bacterium CG22_combo_CG10-13_8_21_14_all_63_91]PJA17074.1 MAG: ATP synthase F0 subunit C [Elusimicrobia bacterium CG_4_10_14_0_2_um_filter_63_34]PJB25078.1 MAG: ATP synthase F0 subunit C [Elusimicrobia bacterium CG_4_9_14_3_um_filter_62_55]